MILGAVTTAAETATLVSGNTRYLELLRSQLDVLFGNAKREGVMLLVPYRYGPKGWFDFRPLEVRELTHLWNLSQYPADRGRIEAAIAGFSSGPRPYDNYNDYAMPITGHLEYRWAPNGRPIDFTQAVSNGDIGDIRQEQEEENEAPRFLWLAGKNPDFPARISRPMPRDAPRSWRQGFADLRKCRLHSDTPAFRVTKLVFRTWAADAIRADSSTCGSPVRSDGAAPDCPKTPPRSWKRSNRTVSFSSS